MRQLLFCVLLFSNVLIGCSRTVDVAPPANGSSASASTVLEAPGTVESSIPAAPEPETEQNTDFAP